MNKPLPKRKKRRPQREEAPIERKDAEKSRRSKGSGGLGIRSPRLPQRSLARICQSLATMLHAGVDVQNAIRMTGDKLSDSRARTAMAEVHDGIIRRGEIAECMRVQGKRFPNLMIDLVEVGERTGALPEALDGLGRHYENNVRMRRQFLGAIAWPAFQLVAAILVIGLLIYVLGFLQKEGQDDALSFSIFGLTGSSGAFTWFFATFGTMAMLFVVYKLLNRNLGGRQLLDPWLMKIPVLGKCMRSFAIARFSWAFALTQKAGMSIKPSIYQSIRATDNGAFIAGTDIVWKNLREGETLTDSLDALRLFPEEFIQTVQVGETSGTVPEVLDRLSPQFEEEAQRGLRALTAAAGWAVWALVAMFVIFMIFNIALQYVGMINDAAKGF